MPLPYYRKKPYKPGQPAPNEYHGGEDDITEETGSAGDDPAPGPATPAPSSGANAIEGPEEEK